MTTNEAHERITLMASGNLAWDLSNNDITALKLMLLEIESLRRSNDALVERDFASNSALLCVKDWIERGVPVEEQSEVMGKIRNALGIKASVFLGGKRC